MTDQTPGNTLTEAEAAYWSEKESGRCKNDRGGYYYDGFIDGFVAAREAHTNTLTDAEQQVAKRLHDHGLCVEIPGDEGEHEAETAACHRFARAALDAAPAPTEETP